MSKDYYNILGVERSATKEEIKKAFRKKAQQFHPDKPNGNEAKFKEINEAYSVLSDQNKRAQYDQFGSAFSGAGGTGAGQQAGGFGGFDFSQFTQGEDIDLGDILGSMFRGGGGFGRMRRGRDISMDIVLTFKESVFGVTRKITVNRQEGGSEELIVNVPAGIDSGEMIRYTGKGEQISDGQPGNLYVRVHVEPHRNFKKSGHHLITAISVPLSEALLGGSRKITTVDDRELTIKIPQGIKHGEMLRVRGEGIRFESGVAGDLLVTISILMPDKLSKAQKKLVEELQKEGL